MAVSIDSGSISHVLLHEEPYYVGSILGPLVFGNSRASAWTFWDFQPLLSCLGRALAVAGRGLLGHGGWVETGGLRVL